MVKKTRTVIVGNLKPGDQITQTGSVFEGAVVAAAPTPATTGDCPCRCPRVLMTDGRVMDVYGWGDVVTIVDQDES
ncbi:hypothetical protein IU449_26880 [Nocardia higoensis]|uniref:PAAR motif-containing protein n=1 Tax=Nocardia higoensis TaxID=228599 RepID=A0ABS0DI37_9NOCA|nr:hypothetical protein [Nocardia higoensis]MBF6358125.1 hypothetical protein [Nocardia higoensis]